MAISVGDKLPNFDFNIMTNDGPGQLSSDELFDNKKVVLVAVPGAFTPTCSYNHLPGYLENLDAIKAKGVDEVAILSVNDVFVMDKWAEASEGKGKIPFLSDGAAKFTKLIGMEMDLSDAGLGVRSKRYSMIVENGEVKALNIEDAPGQAVASGAETILGQL